MDMEPASDESDTNISSYSGFEIFKTSSSHYKTQYLSAGVAIKVKERVNATMSRRRSSEDSQDEDEPCETEHTSSSEESQDSYRYRKFSDTSPHVEIKSESGEMWHDEKNRESVAAHCSEFTDKIVFAKQLVESVLEDTQEIMISKKKESLSNEQIEEEGPSFRFFSNESLLCNDEDDEFTIYSDRPEFSSWPLIGEFTIALGAYKIDEYLSSFKTDEEWLYVIYYLGFIVDNCSELHKYEAIYSLPTFRYPIAQATASLYFSIEVCKSKPPHCPVDVTFQYESFRFKHKPGITDFKEMWLHYILTSKITFFRTLTF